MNLVKLEELIVIKKGRKHTVSSNKNNKKLTRVLFTEDIRSDEKLKYTADESGIYAEIDDLIIAWDGANAGLIGTNKEGFVGSTLGVIKIEQLEILSPQYLKFFIEKNFKYLQRTSVGAVIPHINRKALMNLMIPLISMDLQLKFVEILVNIENLQKKLMKKISLIEEMRLSFYYQIIRQAKNTKKISELTNDSKNKRSIRSGPFGSALKHNEFTKNGYAKVLGIDNISTNEFKNVDRYILKETYERVKNFEVFKLDVIVTIMGTIGRSAVVPDNYGKAINTKHLVAITVNQKIINPYYLSFSIHSNHKIQAQLFSVSRGAIMNGLNIEKIKSLKIPMPSKKLQDNFEIVQKESEKIIELLLRNIEELGVVKKNILLDTFSKNKTTSLMKRKQLLFIKKISEEEIKFKTDLEKNKITEEITTEEDNNKSIDQMLVSIENNEYGEQDKYDAVKFEIFSAIKNDDSPLKQIFDETSESIVLR